MKQSLIQTLVDIKISPIHGYGVFARRNYHAGDIIEECVVIYIEIIENCPSLKDYAFRWPVKDKPEAFISVMAMGNGGLYNHSDIPNAHYRNDIENELIIFQAAKPIYPGDEIVVHYGDDWFNYRGMAKRYVRPGILRQIIKLFR